MMKINRSRGFTLIELLVVIAIIGILSAVVLASLNTARSKGQDAAGQSNLQTIQVQAEIFYGGTGANSYGTAGTSCSQAGSLFAADTTIARALTSAEAVSGSQIDNVCNNSATQYAVASRLPTTVGGTASYYCIDSGGFAGTRTTALGTATLCPAS